MAERPAGRTLRDRLSNPRADRVAQVAALAGRSHSRAAQAARAKTGLFALEGPQGVREAVRYAAHRVRDVYVTDEAAARWPEIVAEALAADLFVHPVTDEVSAAMSGDSQGVLATVHTWDVAAGLDEAVQGARLVAVLCDVRDPGNAGTAIRVADAAGADAVVLAGQSVDVFNPKVVRATAGSLFHLPVVRGVDAADAVAAVRAAGLAVWATGGGGRVELAAADPALARPTAWLFGNEARGLSAAQMALADQVVRIPVFGRAESLNLAAAVSVCLYASAFAHAAGPAVAGGEGNR